MLQKNNVGGNIKKLMRRLSTKRTLLLELAAMGKDGGSESTAAGVSSSKIMTAAAAPTPMPRPKPAGKIPAKTRKPKQKAPQNPLQVTKGPDEYERNDIITNQYKHHHHPVNGAKSQPPPPALHASMLPPLFAKSSFKYIPSPVSSSPSASSSSLSKTPAAAAAFASYSARQHSTKSTTREAQQNQPNPPSVAEPKNAKSSSTDSTGLSSTQQRPSRKNRRTPRQRETKTQTNHQLSSPPPPASPSSVPRPVAQQDMSGQRLPIRESQPWASSSAAYGQASQPLPTPLMPYMVATPTAAHPIVPQRRRLPPPPPLPAQATSAAEIRSWNNFQTPTQQLDEPPHMARHFGAPYSLHGSTTTIIPQRSTSSSSAAAAAAAAYSQPFLSAPQNINEASFNPLALNFVPWTSANFSFRNEFDKTQRNDRPRSSPAIIQSSNSASFDANRRLRLPHSSSQLVFTEQNGPSFSPQKMVRQFSLPVHDLARNSTSENFSTLSKRQIRRTAADAPSVPIKYIYANQEYSDSERLDTQLGQEPEKIERVHRQWEKEKGQARNESRRNRTDAWKGILRPPKPTTPLSTKKYSRKKWVSPENPSSQENASHQEASAYHKTFSSQDNPPPPPFVSSFADQQTVEPNVATGLRFPEPNPLDYDPNHRIPYPTQEYFDQAQGLLSTELLPERQPLLVVLDLNGTLILRTRRYAKSLLRPGFHQFLDHLFANPQRYQVMIWTSARPNNVAIFFEHFVSASTQAGFLAIWCRDRFGFSALEYKSNTQVYKRLDAIWADETIQKAHPHYAQGGRWSQNNTVLVDDSLIKASTHPFNLIRVPEATVRGISAEIKYYQDHRYGVLHHVGRYLDELGFQEDVSKFICRNPIDFSGF